MPSRDLADLDPRLALIAKAFFAQCNTDEVFKVVNAWVFPTCTYRSNEEQEIEWRKGRDANDKIIGTITTKAKPGQSAHNVTLADGTPSARAFDFGITLPGGKCDWNASDPLWTRAISVGISLGLVSLRPWDNPHLEMANWEDQ